MLHEITTVTAPAEEPTDTVPDRRGFAPRITTHAVGALTLGSQKENDSDKEWYFE
ncbi:hypothetical protein ACIPJQ_18420 [Streptomyces griseoviridis]